MWYYQIRLKSKKEITVFFLRVKNNSFHQRPLGEQNDHFLKVVHLNAIKGYMSNNGYEQQFEKKVVILESLFLM